MRDFKELKVWQKAHQLVLKIYKACCGARPMTQVVASKMAQEFEPRDPYG